MYSIPLGRALNHGQSMIPGKSSGKSKNKQNNLKKAILAKRNYVSGKGKKAQ